MLLLPSFVNCCYLHSHVSGGVKSKVRQNCIEHMSLITSAMQTLNNLAIAIESRWIPELQCCASVVKKLHYV